MSVYSVNSIYVELKCLTLHPREHFVAIRLPTFVFSDNSITNILSLPKPLTTYGLHSFRYYTAKLWNFLSDKDMITNFSGSIEAKTTTTEPCDYTASGGFLVALCSGG